MLNVFLVFLSSCVDSLSLSLSLVRYYTIVFIQYRRKCKSIETVEFQHPCRHLCTVSCESILRKGSKNDKKNTFWQGFCLYFLTYFFSHLFWPRVFLCTSAHTQRHPSRCSPLTKKKHEIYSSYLKISFSFIVANPTILYIDTNVFVLYPVYHVYGRVTRIYAFYLLLFSNHHLFSTSKKNVIHHSMMEYMSSDKKK